MTGKSFLEKMKNLLTNLALQSIIAMFRRSGRVSCKLNNERNEKHQTLYRNVQTKLASGGLSQLPTGVRVKSF